jgi:integrase
MGSRQRYQYGCLTRMRRVRSEDVWQFRFYETTQEGQRRRRARTVGSVAQYPTKGAALRVIEPFRLRLNLQHRFGRPTTLRVLADRYVEQELPELRYSTQLSYLSALNQWIGPRWGDCLLEEVKPVPVEQWLRSLHLAPKSKVHIRSLLHLLYQCARRWELTDTNPIELVRQKGGRRRIPRVLTAEQIRLVLEQLSQPYHTMVLIAACLGLRVSEIMGLQWGDFDWENLTVMVQRSVVHGRVGDTKTEASFRPLPVDTRLMAPLQELRRRAFCSGPVDWVFANDAGRPRWQESILQRRLKPAAVRAGVGKIGWHTFRHTYSTMLRSIGTDIKVQQELLRHSTIQSTMNVYTQAVSEQKRAANSKVVEMMISYSPVSSQVPEKASQPADEMNGSQRERVATDLRFAQSSSND